MPQPIRGRLRSSIALPDVRWTVLAADDPANLYGAVLPWPAPADLGGPQGKALSRKAAPSRRSGALVVLTDGRPVLYAAPNLKALTAFTADDGLLGPAVRRLAEAVRQRVKATGGAALRAKRTAETLNGSPILAAPFSTLL